MYNKPTFLIKFIFPSRLKFKKSLMILFFAILVLPFENVLWAKTQFTYPELQVSPRASERLKMEVDIERDNHFFTNLPMQLSALSTLVSGILQMGNVDTEKDSSETSPWIGIIVGGGWTAINWYVHSFYNIYSRGYQKIKNYKSRTKKDQLFRERLAEETINNAASLARRMIWLSFITNLGASAYMQGNAEEGSTAKVTSIISMALSLGPIIFSNHWMRVAKKQREYKKRIYAPLISSAFFQPTKGKIVPGLIISLAF